MCHKPTGARTILWPFWCYNEEVPRTPDMTQPQVQQRVHLDFLEDLQHAFPDPFDSLLPTASPLGSVVESSGPDIGTAEPEPIPSELFPTSDVY